VSLLFNSLFINLIMLKRWLKIYALVLLPFFVRAQRANIDSVVQEANIAENDTIKLIRLRTITRIYAELNPDSSNHYSELSLALARKLHLKLDEGCALQEMGYAYLNKGNYPRSLQILLSAIAILEDPRIEQNALVGKFPGDDGLMYRTASPHLQRLSAIAFTELSLGILYTNSNTNNYERASYYVRMAGQKAVNSGNRVVQSIVDLIMNRVYLNLKKNDSALLSIKRAYELVMESGYKRYLGSILLNTGRTYAALGNVSLANKYYRRALLESSEQGYFRGVVAASLLLAEYYTGMGKKDSAFVLIRDGLSTALYVNAPDLLLRSYTALSRYYRSIDNNDSTVKYQALIIKINDSLFNAKQAQQFQNIDFDEQQRQQQIEVAKKEFRDKWRMYSLLTGLVVILFIAILLWRNSRQRQKANLLLSKQKNELESTLLSLKETQKKLIQSEKMASLGELTAGIAHEIQNPLNFVNNFSDVNKELIDELQADLSSGNMQSATEIANSIKDNEEKINHHGRRAEAIVSGMLQHSRASGQKEPTDVNALVDEYLRLAFHGLRAKDKTFNSEIKTDFDPGIEKTRIVPQEIGRVILNLVSNAFYAVREKQKTINGNYEPCVTVQTKKINDKIEVAIKDNGNGISEKILDKIFQPFFTTKPTGQGTGLGLSMAYDIVKAHGGEIKVETREGEGCEFVIQLPSQA
jgi:two-component system NtrC family sensor kinase